ncbi:MAG TPA: electron-transfer flavoprotein:ubiquinone oxidoreductase [Thermoleophilaceae bacterium]|nr:electron-transfer flavoprotein:ubiquinone oxidoreductase [Thermoleophilaceae bacterium]
MTTAPVDFAPRVDSAKEFVGRPTDSEEERIEVGVVIVGGGPAGLACAIRLSQLLEDQPELGESLGEVPVALVEKGKGPGSHLLSGAMMRPSAMRKLFPDLPEEEWPTYGTVERDRVYLMTKRRAVPLVPTPPPFRNHGNHVTSVAQLGRFLSEKAEEAGVYILGETAAAKLLVEDGVTVGVRTGDKGRGRSGEELGNFEPGSDLIGKATVLAEGSQGHLSGAAIRHFDIGSGDPMQWELGVKEVWEVAKPLDRIIHTLGWPLKLGSRYREFGGSWLYPMGEDKVSLGFVAGLDYRDARFSAHDALQLFKQHPLVREILADGKRVAWGAKTIPSGGYWAIPEQLSAPGLCIAGDSAGMVNVPQLKGIHYAMHAGMFAAEAIVDALKKGDARDLSGYDRRVRESEIAADIYRSRNMRQPFSKGFFFGGAVANAMEMSGGRFPGGHWKTHDDATVDVFIGKARKYPKPDGKLTFDKLSSVFATGNATRDDAPNHIRLREKVPLELALMWQNMCPAQVYEVPEDELEAASEGSGEPDGKRLVKLQVTPSNCVQCGAITAKGGRLTPPEGGDGPNYQLT